MRCMSHANPCGFHLAFEYADQHPVFSSRTCQTETKICLLNRCPTLARPQLLEKQRILARLAVAWLQWSAGMEPWSGIIGDHTHTHTCLYIHILSIYIYIIHIYAYIHKYNSTYVQFHCITLEKDGCQSHANTMLCCRWGNSHPCTPDEPCLLFYVSFCCQKCPLRLKPKEMVDSEVDPTLKTGVENLEISRLYLEYVGIHWNSAWCGGHGRTGAPTPTAVPSLKQYRTSCNSTLATASFGRDPGIQGAPYPDVYLVSPVSRPCCWYHGCTDSVRLCQFKHVWDRGMWVIWGQFNGWLLTGSLGWNNARQEAWMAKSKRPGSLGSQRLQGNCVPVWNLRQAFKPQKTSKKHNWNNLYTPPILWKAWGLD